MTRRSTRAALVAALVVVTATIIAAIARQDHEASLSRRIRVDWATWWVAVVLFYLGVALIGRWALTRDRRKAQRQDAAR